MSEITLCPYNKSLKDIWDYVIHTSKNGNFIHQRNYIEYHSHRFDEQSLLVYKNGSPVAVFPCNKINNHIISHGGLTYGGLIFGCKLRANDVLNIFKKIPEYYSSLNCNKIYYKAIPHIFHRYPAEEDLYALHCMGAKLSCRHLSTAIKLTDRMKLSDSRKNTIRKAEKLGISICEGSFFDDFYSLLSSVLAKYGTSPVHNLEEFYELKARFPDKIRLFGSFYMNKLLAGAIIYDFGHIVHSQYLASSEEGKKSGALDLLIDCLLRTEFLNRKYFSFGISTERGGTYLNEGLVFQKEGFGGRGVVHDVYELSF